MEHYLNLQITPKLIISPFREDNKPTCGFYYGNSGRLYLHDFATDEHLDAISVVQKKYKCSYYKAVQQITADYLKFSNSEKVTLNEDKKLEWIIGNGDLSYFDRYYIKPTTLTKFGVYSCRALYIDEDLYWRSTTNNPIFVYQFKSGRFKAYKPLSPDKTKK
jgi:hypothetical protein